MLRKTVNENAGAQTFLSDSCDWDRPSGQEGSRLRILSVALSLFLWLVCGTPVLAVSQLFAWGDIGQATPIPAANTVSIASGHFHNLTLQADGSVAGLKDVMRIAAGLEFNLALKVDGTVVA